MNNLYKFIIFLIIYIIVICLFGYLYFKTEKKISEKEEDKNLYASQLHSLKQLENIEFIKSKDGYKFINKSFKDIRNYSLFDYILFSSFSFSTAGYYNILQNTQVHFILNIINLIIIILIVPIAIYIFKNHKVKYLIKNIFIQLSIIIIFAILYKIVNYYDVKKKTKFDHFVFSPSFLELLKIKIKNNKLKFITSKRIWHQLVNYKWSDCVYWALITQSTVGYGSLWYPVTRNEKIVNFIHQIVIIFVTCFFILSSSSSLT
jgi:hypothetical protein